MTSVSGSIWLGLFQTSIRKRFEFIRISFFGDVVLKGTYGKRLLGGTAGPALRLIPSLILGLILNLVSPSQLVLYIYLQHS